MSDSLPMKRCISACRRQVRSGRHGKLEKGLRTEAKEMLSLYLTHNVSSMLLCRNEDFVIVPIIAVFSSA